MFRDCDVTSSTADYDQLSSEQKKFHRNFWQHLVKMKHCNLTCLFVFNPPESYSESHTEKSVRLLGFCRNRKADIVPKRGAFRDPSNGTFFVRFCLLRVATATAFFCFGARVHLKICLVRRT